MNAKRRPQRSGASTITDQSDQKKPTRPVRQFDAAHARCVEEACTEDRRYFEAHPGDRRYVRPARAHELCVPGMPCFVMPAGACVEVIYVRHGLRTRRFVGGAE